MQIEIMSRMEAIQYTYLPHKEKSIIISISESNTPKPTFCASSDILDILYLHFDDIYKEDLLLNPMYKIMTTKDAIKIQKFIDKYKNKVDKIIVHCYAGISRSSAVACGISLYLNKDDYWIWNSNGYYPNKWCLTVMNNTLNLGLSEEDIQLKYDLLDSNKNKDILIDDNMLI